MNGVVALVLELAVEPSVAGELEDVVEWFLRQLGAPVPCGGQPAINA